LISSAREAMVAQVRGMAAASEFGGGCQHGCGAAAGHRRDVAAGGAAEHALTRSVRDSAALLDATSGPDLGDPYWAPPPAAAAWIMRYWIRHLGREPGAEEIEPLNRAPWQAGEKVTAASWLLAVGDVQRFGRRVGRFFTGFDAFLTPTMSTPPLPIGEMVSTPEDPWRSLQVSGQAVRYAGIVANLTGNPAMSVPLWWDDDGLPMGVHFLGWFGDEAMLIRLAAQLEAAQPWADRRPAVHAARPREQWRCPRWRDGRTAGPSAGPCAPPGRR
jgi:Asp-tRNA(Asn)/Glu-tRNA(Gln) amidotransferase A subunit family amidase